MKKIPVSLSARCLVVRGNGKSRSATSVTIWLEPLGVQVAIGTLGGDYSKREGLALKEFLARPGSFKLMPGAALAKASGLLPASAVVSVDAVAA